ncbi:hypothetical protein ACTXT7_001541 [Hymenolepis weldensis]
MPPRILYIEEQVDATSKGVILTRYVVGHLFTQCVPMDTELMTFNITDVHLGLYLTSAQKFSLGPEYKVTGLDRDAGYQFVIYGEHTPEGVDPATSLFTGGLNGRRITAFSQEVFVPMDAKAAAAQESKNSASASLDNNNKLGLLDMNTNASNSLMFLILGVLAGAMLIVMVFLVAICFVRQRKEKLRLLAQVNTGDKVLSSHAGDMAKHNIQ